MITVSLDDVIQGKASSNGSCLYLVRSHDAVLYVGQSNDPVERLRQHIGMASPNKQTRLGRMIVSRAPDSRTWQVELWTLADCLSYMPTSDYGIDEAEKALIDRFHPCLNLESNSSPTLLPAGYEDPNPYRAEIQQSNTCKACGRPIVQLAGGHRQRQYCDDNCRQAAFRMRAEQKHRDEVNQRWQAFTPETRTFLDWITSRYGEEHATAIEAAINRELQQRTALAPDEALLAIGRKRNFPRIEFALPDGTRAHVLAGEQAWTSFSQAAEYRMVKRVLEIISQS